MNDSEFSYDQKTEEGFDFPDKLIEDWDIRGNSKTLLNIIEPSSEMLNQLVKTPNGDRHVEEENKVSRNFAKSVIEVRKSKEMHDRPAIVILDEN